MTFRQLNFGCREWRILTGALAIWSICAAAGAWTLADSKTIIPEQPAGLQLVVPLNQPSALDPKRLYALGMIETGNNDREVGKAGEVSRYQIHPAVWKAYSQRMDYRNTEAAVQVAKQHWTWLAGYFVEKAGRQPTDFDMYVMWNTKFGYYAKKGFLRARLGTVVRDRAERFVNLVNRRESGLGGE